MLPPIIHALQHVRRMRGRSQSHLMRASDGNFYVVKFRNNPLHVRILANGYLATKIAALIGLQVAAPAMVEVSDWLISGTPDLRIEVGDRKVLCLPGLQFCSRYAVDPLRGNVLGYLPVSMLRRVTNLQQICRNAGVRQMDV